MLNYVYFSGLLVLCALAVHETFVLGRRQISRGRGVGHALNLVALTLAVVLADIPAALAGTSSWTVATSIFILLSLAAWHLYFGPILKATKRKQN
jgi:hypothetical protein